MTQQPNQSPSLSPVLGSDGDTATETRTDVLINDLVLDAEIGAYDSERGRTQKVRFNLRVSVANPVDDHGDQLDNVVCYDDIVGQIKSILGGGHINLVETLADEILNALFEDARVENATLRIEKLEAIAEAAAVGVEVSRRRR